MKERESRNSKRTIDHSKRTDSTQNSHDVTFDSFRLLPELQAALNANGLTIPTKVQSLLLTKYFGTRKDLLFAAKTGTGKSLGYF